jgi:hypothetical protein
MDLAKTLISSEVPESITDFGLNYAKPKWITERVRYYITRTENGYYAHMEILADNDCSWLPVPKYENKPPTKTLKGCIKRTEKLIRLNNEREARKQAKEQSLARVKAGIMGASQQAKPKPTTIDVQVLLNKYCCLRCEFIVLDQHCKSELNQLLCSDDVSSGQFLDAEENLKEKQLVLKGKIQSIEELLHHAGYSHKELEAYYISATQPSE